MVAISFSVFREKILSGQKRQTIRKYSERRYKQLMNCRVGKKHKLQLYWKQRTKDCHLLFETHVHKIEFLRMRWASNWIEDANPFDYLQPCRVSSPGYRWEGSNAFSLEEAEQLARADGFDSFREFEHFFSRYDHIEDLCFIIIHWNYPGVSNTKSQNLLKLVKTKC